MPHILLLLVLAACGGGGKSAEPATLSVSPDKLLFWPEASVKTLSVSSNYDFTAQLTDNTAWCSVTRQAGGISVSVTQNDRIGHERNAQLFVCAGGDISISKTVNIQQIAVEAQLSVKEKEVIINENDGLEFQLEVSSNIPVKFSLPEWVSLKSGDPTALGVRTYTFATTSLTDADTREGNLSVSAAEDELGKSVSLSVRQSRNVCRFRVATYNILVGSNWNTRCSMVTDVIRKYDFDIFGVQEAPKNQITDILTYVKGYSYTGHGRDDGANAGEHSAIIYKTAKFDILASGDFWYSETPDTPGKGWDATCCNRICSWGKFREKTSGRVFFFFNSHFDHQGTVARYESAKLLVSRIHAIAGEAPTFSTGDYNASPSENSIMHILYEGLLRDSRAVSETEPTGTAGTFSNNSLTLEQMVNRIDYIFVTQGISVKSYGTLNERHDGKYPSDHDPVMITVEL